MQILLSRDVCHCKMLASALRRMCPESGYSSTEKHIQSNFVVLAIIFGFGTHPEPPRELFLDDSLQQHTTTFKITTYIARQSRSCDDKDIIIDHSVLVCLSLSCCLLVLCLCCVLNFCLCQCAFFGPCLLSGLLSVLLCVPLSVFFVLLLFPSLVESIVWLIPVLCVQRKKLKKEGEERRTYFAGTNINIYIYKKLNISIRICGSRCGVSTCICTCTCR